MIVLHHNTVTCAGVVTRAMFAVLARQANMLDGRTCTMNTVDRAFYHGLANSKYAAVNDFNGFFLALQTLSEVRNNLPCVPDMLDDCHKNLQLLLTADHAGQVPPRFQAVSTDAYAAAYLSCFRSRLEALFIHYSIVKPGGLRHVDLCDTLPASLLNSCLKCSITFRLPSVSAVCRVSCWPSASR